MKWCVSTGPSTFIIFLWHPAAACWVRQLYLSPSLRVQQIIVWLSVTSVCQSAVSKSCLYRERTPSGEVSLLRRLRPPNSISPSDLNFAGRCLADCKSWKHSPLRERPSRGCFAERKSYLANLTTCCRLPPGGRRLEDSNLVDPASSHMLVSKTKPCMSKYKCYTVKLRMAH